MNKPSEYRTNEVDISNCECCHCEMLRLKHVRENPIKKDKLLTYEEMFDTLEGEANGSSNTGTI